MPKAKTNLVIVESPSKAKTIGKYLGSDYEVKACMGHLRDLPKSTMGVDLEHDFTPVYQPVKGKEDIIRDLKASAKKSDQIYLATDPDREGEAISWHLQALLGIPDSQVNRVTFNEITRGVVTRAIQNPRAIDQDLVDAQQARRILDRIVGYRLSPLLWKKVRRGHRPDGCSRWPPGWWWIARRKSAPSSPRSTGPSTSTWRGRKSPALSPHAFTAIPRSGSPQ